MAFTQINDLTFHYKIEGSAENPPLVFVNSLGSDLRIWDDVVPYFDAQHFVIRYDKRGHGLSDCPAGPYSISDHANDLAGLLTELRLATAVLVGISVGGMIALDFAARHPSRVRKLILSDTGAVIGTPSYWTERISSLRDNGYDELGEPILARWFSPIFAETQSATYRGYYNMLTRTPLVGYIATCAAIRDADLRQAARSLPMPALVLCGAEDKATPPELGQELASMLADGRFQTIPHAAHLPCIEQPAAMARAIRRFVL